MKRLLSVIVFGLISLLTSQNTLGASGSLILAFTGGLDSDLNTIPAKPTALSGNYNFATGGTEGVNLFINALERLGVEITYSRDGKGGSSSAIFELRCDSKHAVCTLSRAG